MQRLGETLDRMESRGTEYFQRVRDGFLLEANRKDCGAIQLVDATRSVEEMHAEICGQTGALLSGDH